MVVFVDQVHHHLHHDVLLLRSALCDHQSEGHKRVVGNAFVTILGIEHMVVVEKPQEEHGRNALVSVAERMVLHHEIKQHGRLLLYGRVKFLPIKRLINLSDTTLERLVFLVCKPLASTKLNLQPKSIIRPKQVNC